jgi:hypothetical protein
MLCLFYPTVPLNKEDDIILNPDRISFKIALTSEPCSILLMSSYSRWLSPLAADFVVHTQRPSNMLLVKYAFRPTLVIVGPRISHHDLAVFKMNLD